MEKRIMIKNLFLCVGAQKAGTTWLYAQLKDHPEIGFSGVKEVHYFNTLYCDSILLTRRKVNELERILKEKRSALERYFSNVSSGKPVNKVIHELLSPVNDQWYIKLFSHSGKKYAADFSPEYALLPDAGFENIKRVCQNKKILFIMRDPVDRAKSAMRYFFEMQNTDIRDVTREELVELAYSDMIIEKSSYHVTVQKLQEHFRPEDLLFLFYEDLMRNKQKAINQITDFLEVAAVALPEERLERKVNVTHDFDFSNEIDKKLKAKLKDTYDALSARFSKLPESWGQA